MSEQSLKIAFAGTPDLAATALQKILSDAPVEVEFILTQPDRPSGRGRQLKTSPVKVIANDKSIAVHQPESPGQIDPSGILYDMDVMVVAAYGMLLPEDILNRPKHGCINIHTSLLPRWRGAAPIQRAIEAGDTESGVTIMQMDAGLDTGPMLLQIKCPIEPNETAGSLHDKLASLGGDAIVKVLNQISQGNIISEQQDESRACYAKKIFKQDAEIDWQQPASVIERKIRAFNPAPVCFCILNGMRLTGLGSRRIGQATRFSSGYSD